MEKKILPAFIFMILMLVILAMVGFMSMHSYRAQTAREYLSLLAMINKLAPAEKSGEIVRLKSEFLDKSEQDSKKIHTVMTIVTAVSVFLAILIAVFILRIKQDGRLKVTSAADETGPSESRDGRVAGPAFRPSAAPKKAPADGPWSIPSIGQKLGIMIMIFPVLLMTGLGYYTLSAAEHDLIEIVRGQEGNREKPADGQDPVVMEKTLESIRENIHHLKTNKRIIIIAAILSIILGALAAGRIGRYARKEPLN